MFDLIRSLPHTTCPGCGDVRVWIQSDTPPKKSWCWDCSRRLNHADVEDLRGWVRRLASRD